MDIANTMYVMARPSCCKFQAMVKFSITNALKKKATPKAIELPKRSAVNKVLADCKNDDEHKKLYDGFIKKYGESALDKLTGHKQETWSQLFGSHFNRVNHINPTLDNPLQDQFDQKVNDCTNLEEANAIADFLDANEAIQNQANTDIVLDLQRTHS